jgi:hypothetical protein
MPPASAAGRATVGNTTMPPSLPHRSSAAFARPSGSRVVVGLLALGAALAAFALAFQWRQTDGCLGFYGSDVARAIAAAPHVELWALGAGAEPGRLVATGRCDVSRAPGLVHLRRGLVEDANFDWRPSEPRRLSPERWSAALVFAAAPGDPPAAIIAIGFDPGGGALCVVGQPGRVRLGRIERGLRTWVEASCPRPETGPGAGK